MNTAKKLQTEVKTSTTIDREAMARGYMEMASINMMIAGEDLHLENEAEVTTNSLMTN